MSTSLYYQAKRTSPLFDGEQATLADIQARHPFSALLAQLGVDECSYDGEPFGVFPVRFNEPGVIFGGAVKLPSQEVAAMAAARYWCALLSEARHLLPDAAWRVHIDDYDIAWSEQRQAFDPSV